MFGVCRAREIIEIITRRIDLWERGIHTGLLGREARATCGGEEENENVSWSYHDTVLWSKLRQAVYWATNREGVGCLLPYDQCSNTGQLVAEVLQEKHPDTRTPPKTPKVEQIT